MEVELARNEGADDEVWALEGLMHGGWLVDTPGDWFEVGNVEDPGIFVAIPAYDVAGVECSETERVRPVRERSRSVASGGD